MVWFPKWSRNIAISVPSNHHSASLRPCAAINWSTKWKKNTQSVGTFEIFEWSIGHSSNSNQKITTDLNFCWRSFVHMILLDIYVYTYNMYIIIYIYILLEHIGAIISNSSGEIYPRVPVTPSGPKRRPHRLGSYNQSHCRSVKTFQWCWHWPKNLENESDKKTPGDGPKWWNFGQGKSI